MDDFPALDKAALDAESVRALDELVADAKLHGARIQESFAKTDERIRQHRIEEAKRAGRAASGAAARETSPPYGDISERLDRIERTLVDMREQMATKADLEAVRATMATKVELESMSDKIRQVADSYKTANHRMDRVAELLKLRVVLP